MSQLLRQLFLATVCLGVAAPSLALSETSEFSSQARLPDSSDVRLSTSGRAPVLLPIQLSNPLHSHLQARLQQDGLSAQALQVGVQVSQRADSLRSEPTGVPPHRRRWDAFRSEVISLKPLSGGFLSGTIGHLADSPDSWDRDVGGYLGRVGTSMGSQVAGIGVQHGVSAALDLKLESPEPQGPLPARLWQVVVQEVTIRTASGQRVPIVARATGMYMSDIAQNQIYYGRWKPGEAATSTAVAIGNGVAVSLIRELIGAL